MSRKKQTRGNCAFCGREMTKGGLTRHLKTCAERQKAIAVAASQPGRKQTLYHLLVLDQTPGYSPNDPGAHWLHLEIKGNATLQDLDNYLRAIWLECCGHLSAFEIGRVVYTQIFDDDLGWRVEKPMTARVDRLFAPGMDISYEYDFGTSSLLRIRVVGERRGKSLTRHPIYLMARNTFAPPKCHLCDEPAKWICVECQWSGETFAFCQNHAKTHAHRDMQLPVVNSPRTGLCGYTGPAEPPY